MDFSALYREEKTKRSSPSGVASDKLHSSTSARSRSRKKDTSTHGRDKSKSSRSHSHRSKSSTRKDKAQTHTSSTSIILNHKKKVQPPSNPTSVHPALLLGPSRGSSIKILSLRPPEPQDIVEVPTSPFRNDESFYREWNYEGEGSKHHGAFQLNIKQNSSYGHGGLVWDCSLVLARFLQRHLDARAWKGKWVLELGAGTGLVGLVAASLGAERVRLSDLSEITPLLEENVNLNAGVIKRSDVKVIDFCWGSTDPEVLTTDHRRGSWTKHKETFFSRLSLARGSYSHDSLSPVTPQPAHKHTPSVTTSPTTWSCNSRSRSRSHRSGRPSSSESPKSSRSNSRRFFDIVVASDVAYDPSSFEPLREVLREVCGPKTLVFMSHEWREKDKEDTFFSTLKPEFVCELVPLRDLDPDYHTEDISVFKIRRLLL